MTRFRVAATAALLTCAVALGAAGTASAQDVPDAPAFTKKIAVTGKNKGKDFTGTFTIKRFENRAGQAVAVGVLKGKLKNRKVTRRGVAIPVESLERHSTTGAGAAQATCDILHLVLGPLDLNLLGLRVQLNRVVLDITGETGPGNLLGNLLCGLFGILDPPALGGLTTAINNLVAVLNSFLALVPTGPATAAAAGPR